MRLQCLLLDLVGFESIRTCSYLFSIPCSFGLSRFRADVRERRRCFDIGWLSRLASLAEVCFRADRWDPSFLLNFTLTGAASLVSVRTIHAAMDRLAFEQMSVSEGGVSTPGGCQVHEPGRGLFSSRSVGFHAASERLAFEQTSVSEGGATAPGGCQTLESRQRSAFEQDRWASVSLFGLGFGWSGLSLATLWLLAVETCALWP